MLAGGAEALNGLPWSAGSASYGYLAMERFWNGHSNKVSSRGAPSAGTASGQIEAAGPAGPAVG